MYWYPLFCHAVGRLSVTSMPTYIRNTPTPPLLFLHPHHKSRTQVFPSTVPLKHIQTTPTQQKKKTCRRSSAPGASSPPRASPQTTLLLIPHLSPPASSPMLEILATTVQRGRRPCPAPAGGTSGTTPTPTRTRVLRRHTVGCPGTVAGAATIATVRRPARCSKRALLRWARALGALA